MTSTTFRRAAALAPFALAVLAASAFARERDPVEIVVGPGVRVPAIHLRLEPHGCTGAELAPTAKNLEVARAATLCLLNAERGLRGLLPLTERAPITQESLAYSQRMVEERFFDHDRPVGYLLDSVHLIVAQNIAWGDGPLAAPARIVDGWMASPAHRRNILDPVFSEVGVGIAIGSPEPRSRLHAATYTTDFGVIGPSAAPAPAPAPPTATVKRSAKRSVKRKTCTVKRTKRKHLVAKTSKAGKKRKRAACPRRSARRAAWLG